LSQISTWELNLNYFNEVPKSVHDLKTYNVRKRKTIKKKWNGFIKADYMSRTFSEQRTKVERNSQSDVLENFVGELEKQSTFLLCCKFRAKSREEFLYSG